MALTTLSKVKGYLGIPTATTTYDSVITDIINAVSESIELYCGRNFDQGIYTSIQFGSEFLREHYSPNLWDIDDGGSAVNYPTIAKKGEDIVLDNMPINAVLYAAYGSQALIEVTYDGSSAGNVDVVATDKVILVENLTQTEVAFDETMTIQDVATAINALANWTATVSDSNYASYPAKSLLFSMVGPEDTDDKISLHAAISKMRLTRQTEGLYRANVKLGSNTTMLILYDGGYAEEDLPFSLVEVATKASADAFNGIKKEAGLKKEDIGDYTWERFSGMEFFSYYKAYVDQLDLFRRIPMGVQ